MYFFYQTVEHSQQRWLQADARQLEQIRRADAYHLSIYQIDALHENLDQIRYKGDLWFDIDHKPKDDGSLAAALKDAINDTRRLVSYLESIGLDPKFIQLYASGGKGFHVCIPASLFSSGTAIKNLPRIYKYMAEIIRDRAGILGLDMNTYSSGKGKLMRVENKLRDNGKYKVPVTPDELRVMTPEMYQEVTSKPRALVGSEPVGLVSELVALFTDAQREFDRASRQKVEQLADDALDAFANSPPKCVDQLVHNEGCKQFEGVFNSAKMSLARYLMNAPLTESHREELLDTFADHWSPSRYPTKDARKKAVREAYPFAQENGFGCGFMYSLLTESPCSGCPIREEQDRKLAERSSLQNNKFAYVRQGRTPIVISNFVLAVTSVYYDLDDPDEESFAAIECRILRGDLELGNIKLHHSAWQSSAAFKRSISAKPGVSWTGNDVDLQNLKALLTDRENLKDKKIMYVTKTVGIAEHPTPEGEEKMFAWVGDNWSTTGLVADTMRLDKPPKDKQDNTALELQSVRPLTGVDQHQNETLHLLLNCNAPMVVAPVLGWVVGCWLRTHWRSLDNTDKHLPALQIYGSSGQGKTETATLFSMLAGSNYLTAEPLVVSGSTPYAIKTEAGLSTTVPRIFDEMNPHKISEQSRYSTAREVVKASARGGSNKAGMLGEEGAKIDSKPATAPLIMLATQLNTEEEIRQRTIPVSINRALRTPEHTGNFIRLKQRRDDLIAFAARAMRVTLNLKVEWVQQTFESNLNLIDPLYRYDRIGSNWMFVLSGLDYLVYVLSERQIATLTGPITYLSAPSEILAQVRQLKQEVLNWLEANSAALAVTAVRQEIDKVVDMFGTLVITQKALSGQHFAVIGETLYVWSAVLFPMYVQHCRTQLQTPELTDLSQYQDLLQHQAYYIGNVAPDFAAVRTGWHALSIPEMRKRGIIIDNFAEKV